MQIFTTFERTRTHRDMEAQQQKKEPILHNTQYIQKCA